MKKVYFSDFFTDSSKLVDFLNERVNDVNVVSITYRSVARPHYVLFYWCYEPKEE